MYYTEDWFNAFVLMILVLYIMLRLVRLGFKIQLFFKVAKPFNQEHAFLTYLEFWDSVEQFTNKHGLFRVAKTHLRG